MYKETNGFRTTLLGGFCREDVLSYIEKTAKESMQRLETLEVERNQALLEVDALHADNVSLKEKNAELLERMGELTLDAEQQREALSGCQSRLQTCEAALQAAQERAEALETHSAALSEQLASLTAAKEQYDADKEHLAEMELDAMRRIKDMETRAQAEVEQTRTQAAALISAAKTAMQKISCRWRENISALNNAAEEQSRINTVHSRSADALFDRMEETIHLLDQAMADQQSQVTPAGRAPLQEILAEMQTETQEEGDTTNGTL